MARNSGIVTALLVGLGAVALVPAFSGAVDSVNFSAITYGDELAVVMEQFPLLVALFAVVFIGMEVSART
jgi:Flp pilus assembly pilin Flp